MSDRLDRIEALLETHIEKDIEWKTRHEKQMTAMFSQMTAITDQMTAITDQVTVMASVLAKVAETQQQLKRSNDYLMSRDGER